MKISPTLHILKKDFLRSDFLTFLPNFYPNFDRYDASTYSLNRLRGLKMHRRGYGLILLLLLWLSPFQQGYGQNMDLQLLERWNTQRPEEDHLWKGVSNSMWWVTTSYIAGNFIYAAAFKEPQARQYAIETSISVGLNILLTESLKLIVHRPRPVTSYPDRIHTYSSSFTQSFPSGHTSIAFATSTIASFQTKQIYFQIPIFTWSTGVGFSRIRLGKHFPSDVLAGVAIGVGSGFLGHYLTREILYKN